MKTPASCGTSCAEIITPRDTAARSVGEAPASDCTTNSKPDELPSPMMGGRLKAKTLAEAIWLKAMFSSFSALNTESEGSLRSANGFSSTTTSARLGSASPSIML